MAVLICAPASAQTAIEQRLALVIGNAAYKDQPLRNSVNDAKAISTSLRKLGFIVIERTDATKKIMEDAILEFSDKLRGGGIGLFYFAGHGLQVRGHNYLLPIGSTLPSEAAVRFQAVDVDAVLEQMTEARNRANLVILDACRNNPFQIASRGAPKGLAAIDAARGTLIAYATAPGSVATDGEGPNSDYSAALVRALEIPNLKVEEVFKEVRRQVNERTKGAQIPWESSSLTGDLILNSPITISQPPPQLTTQGNRDPGEIAFWTSISASTDARDFEDYLRQFPNGLFAPIAKRRVEEFRKKQVNSEEALKRIAEENLARKNEAERMRQAAELERQRLAALETERKRQVEDAERKRQAAEAERQRLVALEIERKRQSEDAERKRQAVEVEKQQQATLETQRQEQRAGETQERAEAAEAKQQAKEPEIGRSQTAVLPLSAQPINKNRFDGEWHVKFNCSGRFYGERISDNVILTITDGKFGQSYFAGTTGVDLKGLVDGEGKVTITGTRRYMQQNQNVRSVVLNGTIQGDELIASGTVSYVSYSTNCTLIAGRKKQQ